MLRELLWRYLGRPHAIEHQTINQTLDDLEKGDRELAERIAHIQSVVEARFELQRRESPDAP
jgi:hypothetical protein